MLEAVFERLVLAIVGSAIEQDCGEEGGAILGVVGSRRQRGDRCEIWLGGKTQESAPTEQWIEKVRQRISQEIELPTQKYKQVRPNILSYIFLHLVLTFELALQHFA